MALGKGLNSLIPQRSRFTFRRETGDGQSGGSERVWQIPISEITPNSEQPRRNFDHNEMEELVASVKKHGILQPPIVTEKLDGGYELIAGERRWRAAQIAGLLTVPCLVRAATQQEKLELALIENIQRQDLNPIEEAFAYQRLIEEFGLTQQDVADQVGKSRPAVTNMIRLLGLPDEIKRALIDDKISVGKAKTLLSLKDEREQLQLYRSLVGQEATVRDVEKIVASRGQASRKGSIRRDPNLWAQEQLLEERLGTKVQINQKGEKGTIVVYYSSHDELQRLLTELV